MILSPSKDPVLACLWFKISKHPTDAMTLFEYDTARDKAFAAMGGESEDVGVPEMFCRNICHNITVWFRQGSEVAARKDSNRMRRGRYGWELPLGENRFGVELAVRWSRQFLCGCFLQGEPRPFKFTPMEAQRLQNYAAQAVIGYGDRLYRNSYPVEDGRLWFGTHAVVLAQFVTSLGHFSGLNTNKPEFIEEAF